MPSEATILSAILTVVVGLIFAYGAYWALIIRRALMSQLYRRQALWVGGVGVYFGIVSSFVALAIFSGVTGYYLNIPAAVLTIVGFVVVFDWIDSTIIVARRSDPLLRNTLHWSKLRYFIGITSGIGLSFNVIFNVVIGNSFYSNPASPPIVGYIGTVLLLGAIALLVSGRRSADTTLRRHLKWFGVCALLLWISGQMASPWANVSSLPVFVPIITYSLFGLAAYCLYRSARTLVPLGHLAIADSQPSTTPATVSVE